jgi:hypothetical protein
MVAQMKFRMEADICRLIVTTIQKMAEQNMHRSEISMFAIALT